MTHTRGEQTYWYIACTRLFFLLDSHWKNSSAGMLSSVQQVTFSKSLLIQGGWCFAFFSISQSLIYKVSCTLLNVVWRFFFLVGCLFVFLLIISFLQVSTQSFRFSVTFYSLAILRRKKKTKQMTWGNVLGKYTMSRFVALLTVSVLCMLCSVWYVRTDFKPPWSFIRNSHRGLSVWIKVRGFFVSDAEMESTLLCNM